MEKLIAWVDARLPVVRAFEDHMSKYYALHSHSGTFASLQLPGIID